MIECIQFMYFKLLVESATSAVITWDKFEPKNQLKLYYHLYQGILMAVPKSMNLHSLHHRMKEIEKHQKLAL